MKKRRKRNSTNNKPNQLSFDFNLNIPFELHTPKSEISSLQKRKIDWDRRPIIELVKG
jgi:hypothetical protein